MSFNNIQNWNNSCTPNDRLLENVRPTTESKWNLIQFDGLVETMLKTNSIR